MVNQPIRTQTLPRYPVITSETDPIQVDFLSKDIIDLPGSLGMTIAPGKCNQGMNAIWKRSLDKDLAYLCRHYGVEVLVTLLVPSELEQLNIPDLISKTQAYGLRSHWFPIRDFGVPASMDGLISLVKTILTAMQAKKTIVVHCKAGLGRTGLVAAACLVALGYSPEQAFVEVRHARPGSVETEEQEDYLAKFARAIANTPLIDLPN